jgi:hypothetical protein
MPTTSTCIPRRSPEARSAASSSSHTSRRSETSAESAIPRGGRGSRPARSQVGCHTSCRNQYRGRWPSVSRTRGCCGESTPAARRAAR